MRRRTVYALEMALVLLALSAVAVGAAPQVSVTLDPTRSGPRPYPVWTAYPFELSANGSHTLDEATAKLVSAGQAAVSTSYAWTYAPAQLVLAAPDAAWAQFLYDEKYAETDQALSVAYTVTVTFSEALDRAPEETTATATLAIDVVGTGGGGLRQDPQDAELLVVPAAQNGEVCDRVEVRVKVYKPDFFGSFWWRRPGQDWGELMGAKVDETPDYNEYMYSWVSQMDKNVGMDWKATSLRLVMDPPPGHFDTLETDVETWTPNNTVVAATGKVLTWDPEVPANCDTEATFDLSHLDYEDPENGDPDVKIVIFRDPNTLAVTHGAIKSNCTCGDGRWRMYGSKLGPSERIEHRLDQLDGGVYGDAFRYYKHQ